MESQPLLDRCKCLNGHQKNCPLKGCCYTCKKCGTELEIKRGKLEPCVRCS